MNILRNIDALLVSWGMPAGTADSLDQFIAFAIVLLVAFLADMVCRHVVLKAVARLVKRTKATWDDVVFDQRVMARLSHIVMPLVVYLFIPVAFQDTTRTTIVFIQNLCFVAIVCSLLLFLHSFLNAAYTVYSQTGRFRNRPLKSLVQTFQVVMWLIGGIVILSTLLGRDPLSLLAGLGASAAILTLVFKDSIMGFVSSVQLTYNDMLKVGDWIKMSKYGADGIVIEVTLNTVKVRNWDNTVTTIPPYLLVSDSFENWQAMRDSGGRRVKRSVNIDMSSVHFCSAEELDRLRRIPYLAECIDRRQRELDEQCSPDGTCVPVPSDDQRFTNLGLFRAYLTEYLRHLPVVNTELHCMVRHLQPTEHGLPVELYFFSSVKDWIPYEQIQADVFDHVLAVVPRFGLRLYQAPSGSDLRRWAAPDAR